MLNVLLGLPDEEWAIVLDVADQFIATIEWKDLR